jgi:shikimate kinase
VSAQAAPPLPEATAVLRLALVGLPGCGKSTIGRQLARRLALDFIDSDAEIEKRLGMSIRQYFELHGEAAFREVEQAVLEQICTAPASCVLATGGGIVLRQVNRQILKERARVVYLHASVSDLWRRLRNDTKRPLLQGDDAQARLKALAREREPLYRDVAEFVVETGRQPPAASVNTIAMQMEVLGLVNAHASDRT